MSSRRIAVLIVSGAALAAAVWLIARGAIPTPETGSQPEIANDRPATESALVGTEDARADLPRAGEPRPEWIVRGSVLLGGRHVVGARMLAYAGQPRDKRLAFATLMDEAARGDPNRLTLTTSGDPVASADVAVDGSFTFETDRRHLRLVLDDRFWSLPSIVPVHLPEDPAVVDLGVLEAHLGGHVVGRLIGAAAPASTRLWLVADVNPMSVLEDPRAFMAHSLRRGGAETKLEADGRFEFRAVMPSPRVTVVLDSEEVPARSEPFALAAGETREIVLRPVPTGSIHALVVRAEDRSPLAGARVSAIPLDEGGEMGRRRMTRRERTAADGEASVDSLPLGTWRVVANHRDCRPAHVEVVVGAGERTKVALVLDAGGTLSGRVVDAAGRPIADAGVETMPEIEIPMFGDATELMGRDLIARVANDASCRTDEQGHFELRGVPRDRPVAIAAAHAEYAAAIARDAHAGDAGIELVLEPMAELRGRVVDAVTGAPIPTFTVRTKVRMALFIERASSIVEVADAEDGAFALHGVTPGQASLEVFAPGYGKHEQKIAVESAAIVDLGSIELHRAGTIRGSVVTPDGVPVAGATVAPRRGGMLDNPILVEIFGEAGLRTGSDGTFEMTGVPPGRLILQATASGFAKGTSKRLTVEAGGVLDGVEIELGLAGRVRGRLLLPPGRATEDWQVLAVLDVRGAVGSSQVTDGGRFEIDGLDPGSYQIQAMDVESFSDVTVDMQSATESGELPDIGGLMRSMQDLMVSTRAVVRAGETTEVELDATDLDAAGIRLVGTVRIGDRALTEGLVEVEAVRGEQPRISQALIQDGRFEVHRLQPGSVRLRLRAGLTLSPVGDPLTVEIDGDDATERVEWQLPGGRIGGRVVDAETGKPITGACVRLQQADARGEPLDFGFALTGDDGRFAFEGLAAGRFHVIADESLLGSERHAGGRLENLELEIGATLDDLELRARPGAGVELVVASDAGAPLAHALALAVDGDGHPIGSFPIALTNGDGRAWLSGLPSGRTRIVVRHERYVPSVSPPRDLIAGEHVAVHVALRRGTAVEVELLDADGQPLAGANVAVRWQGTPWIPTSLFARPTGSVVDLGQLPPGECEFSVTHARVGFTAKRTIPATGRARLVLTP